VAAGGGVVGGAVAGGGVMAVGGHVDAKVHGSVRHAGFGFSDEDCSVGEVSLLCLISAVVVERWWSSAEGRERGYIIPIPL
jgi:hypothetical protein